MELIIVKYGNLMGSPDVKRKMFEAGVNTPESDKLFDQIYGLKISMGLNGQSTSAILLEPECPELFPAVVDFSFICADPASHNESSIDAAMDALKKNGVSPADVKSIFVTHPHGDHHDPRMLPKFTNAEIYADPDSKIPGTKPFPDNTPSSIISIDTPGHGTPHCSFIVDLLEKDISVCIAGDLIMSHAHYLSMDGPLAFSDAAKGKESVNKVLSELHKRNTRFKMILPGHDIPFFV